MALELQVPDSFVPHLQSLAQLPPQSVEALLQGLREERPSLGLHDLAKSIATRLSLEEATARGILELLSSLHVVREGLGEDIPEFVAALRRAMEATGKPELQPSDWPTFLRAITEAFLIDTLSISARALDVVNDHQNLFLNARVLTDLRPVFRSDVGDAPTVMVPVHTLKLVYRSDGVPRNFYVALDSQDVTTLLEILHRAVEKEKSIRALAETKNLNLLEVKT